MISIEFHTTHIWATLECSRVRVCEVHTTLGRCISATRKSGWPSAGSCRIVYGGSAALQGSPYHTVSINTCSTVYTTGTDFGMFSMFSQTGPHKKGLNRPQNVGHQRDILSKLKTNLYRDLYRAPTYLLNRAYSGLNAFFCRNSLRNLCEL